MKLTFYKYQGTGNDFIMLDNRSKALEDILSQEKIAFLCDRRFGIGADGLILLSDSVSEDFRMMYYNADGNESTMCGNGGRCLVAFAHELGIKKDKLSFDAIDGLHYAWVQHGMVRLQMVQAKNYRQKNEAIHWVDTGSPHLVLMEEREIKSIDVEVEGAKHRWSKEFEEIGGTNVNFVNVESGNRLNVRTFERGVEGETLSCGTGVTAAAYAYLKKEDKSGKVAIRTLGGDLSVEIESIGEEDEQVFLEGPAKKVFEGTIELTES
ncbi:MAG: diaminopimelate epimerase [Bacteroidota bacterium]